VSSAGSVTHWLAKLKGGDAQAAQQPWERFYARLVNLARSKLRALPRGPADEEDLALSAFDQFCRAAQQGRFPRLEDRSDLWEVLAMLTERKALDHRRRERRLKRGGGKVRDEASLECGAKDSDGEVGLAALASNEPTPEFAALVAEEYRLLLNQLADDKLQAVAVAKMEGHSNDDLAKQLRCSVSTVERKLKLIRRIWNRRAPDAPDSASTE
jgi:DNA-directed RNA polymerase specialized sigma24 family protein